MFSALNSEIKNSLFSHWFKFLRWLGVLLLPLIYAFIYIFAFFDPFERSSNLDLRVIAPKNSTFAKEITNELSKSQNLKIGEMDLKIKFNSQNPNSLYTSQSEINYNSGNSIIVFNENFDSDIKNAITYVNQNPPKLGISKIIALFQYLSSHNNNLIQFKINTKKNYLIGLGLDISVTSQPVQILLANKILETGSNSKDKVISDFFKPIRDEIKLIKNNSGQNFNFSLVENISEMDKNAKYGFGLTPFFLSIGIWIGAMGISLSINPRIYNKKISSIKTYFVKLTLTWISSFLQLCILFLALYLIGFDRLGINFVYLMTFSFIVGFLLASIVMSIRFMIPNKPLGIVVVLITLVIQMVSSGGLFPVATQNVIFKIIHPIVPFTYSIGIFRELLFNTLWINILFNTLILLTFAIVFTLLGVFLFNHNQKKKVKNNLVANLGDNHV